MNVSEAHRIDLISTSPYVIVTDQADNALDIVEFPKLREGRDLHGRRQRLRLQNYNDLNYTDGKITEEDVTGILLRRAGGGLSAPDRQHAAAAGGAAGSGPADGTVCVRTEQWFVTAGLRRAGKALRRCPGCATGRPESVRARRRSRPGVPAAGRCKKPVGKRFLRSIFHFSVEKVSLHSPYAARTRRE